MKWSKRLVCMLLILMTTALTSVAAPKTPEAVSYFAQGQKIYVFCDMKGLETKGMTVRQFGSSSEKQMVEQLGDISGTVHYVLVIDSSTSMDKHWKKVRQFVETLIKENENTNLKVTYTLATIGEAYKPILERADDGDAVLTAMKEKLSYTETRSNLYKGIMSALDYLNRMGRQEGELTDLIVISDGVPYNASVSPTLEEVTALLKEKKENLVQTIGMDGEIALGSMNYSGGTEEMEAAAASITGYIRSLSRVQFFQKTGVSSLNFYFQEEGKQADSSMTMKLTEIPTIGDLVNTSGTLGESEVTEQTDPSETSMEETKNSEEEPEGSTEEPESSEVQSESSTEETESSTAVDKEEEIGGKTDWKKLLSENIPLIGIILGVAVLTAGLFAAFWIRARKKNNATAYHGVPIELEVLSGKCITAQRTFYLAQELIIGSDADCDIIFNSQAVSGKNTRVFLCDGKIYIEDLKSARGTALGGMRIYAPNVLRSGEVISIERVAFKLIY